MSGAVATPARIGFGGCRQSVTPADYPGNRFLQVTDLAMPPSKDRLLARRVAADASSIAALARAEAPTPARTPVFSSPWAALIEHILGRGLQARPARL